MKTIFVILVAIMAVTKGVYAQSLATPRIGAVVNTRSAIFRSFNETKIFNTHNTHNTPFFYRIGGINVINGLPPKPLVLVDGLEFSEDLSILSADNIKRITVLKSATAVEIFGTRGINGVVLIETNSTTTAYPNFCQNVDTVTRCVRGSNLLKPK